MTDPSEPMDRLRVLIVEDEALLAMELESIIEDNGHEVVGWAANARQARELIDHTQADVAFVDVHLADGPTGIEVADYIRAHNQSMVVFLTANPKRLPENYAGAVGVISKPYTIGGLTAALRYLHEGVRKPPPVSSRPVGFTLAPDYARDWT